MSPIQLDQQEVEAMRRENERPEPEPDPEEEMLAEMNREPGEAPIQRAGGVRSDEVDELLEASSCGPGDVKYESELRHATNRPKPNFGFTTREDLGNWFTHHPPTGNQAIRYQLLREEFKSLAGTVLDLTPSCPDQTVAIRKLREAMMAANQCIACNEQTTEEAAL